MSVVAGQTAARFTARSPPPTPVPPVVNGEPRTRLNVPSLATANPDTVFGPATSSFVYTKLFCAYRFVVKRNTRSRPSRQPRFHGRLMGAPRLAIGGALRR